jgi:hypothetical protein
MSHRKVAILESINSTEIPVKNLANYISEGFITEAEMLAAGLNNSRQEELKSFIQQDAQAAVNQNEVIEFCKRIEREECSIAEIKQKLNSRLITVDDIKQHTTLDDFLLNKILNYNSRPIERPNWTDLAPLQDKHTDLYFFGIVNSGKSCVMASLFSYMDRHGLAIERNNNPTGTRYAHQLAEEFRNGILPKSTSSEGINYIQLELRNPVKGKNHPLNIIEMSGEFFNNAYNRNIEELKTAFTYLKNNNRKLIFFVLDYKSAQTYVSADGAMQHNKMKSVLDALDMNGILGQTDAIFLIITKSDLFPNVQNKLQYTEQFINQEYKSFIETCKDKRKKHKGQFDIVAYPYSIGKVKFDGLLTEVDEQSPKNIIKAIWECTHTK